MRIISRKALRDFWEQYPDAEPTLREWLRAVQPISWRTPQDIAEQFPRARFVGSNRVIFNVRRNRYRLVVAVNYGYGIVYIRFIGTHAQYDRIDVGSV